MVGTILLTNTNKYIVDGALPERPPHDKELLSKVVNSCYVSGKGFATLPNSIRLKCKPVITANYGVVPITIPELAKADVLLVSRSPSDGDGKEFRLNNFKKLEGVEVWVKV